MLGIIIINIKIWIDVIKFIIKEENIKILFGVRLINIIGYIKRI